MTYDVNYFIKKFEAIPENFWTTRTFLHGEKSCALGHCGVGRGYTTLEGDALYWLFLKINKQVTNVNDGHSAAYQQPTPKQRVLAALYDIKAMLDKQSADAIINEALSKPEECGPIVGDFKEIVIF